MSFNPGDAKSIFLHAADLSLADRDAFVDQACAGQPELKARVQILLKTAHDPDSLLDHPVAEIGATQALPAGPLSLEFLEPSDHPESLGRIGDYTVLEVIGRGGMGIVMRGIDSKLNRVAAIKVLVPEFAGNPQARKRFLREAQAAAAVSHDHIVTIHAVDDDAKLPFIVMECILGQSVQQKIDKVGALGLKEILRIGMQIAAGLAAAHKQGLVHRDIKPANILLENGIERVKITDFGLARATDDVGITQSGQIAGTPQYMSPEQAMGQPVDPRSDLFSLGSVLYTMCTGRPAFRADSTVAVLRRVCDDTPRPIGEVNPEIPDWLVGIVNRLMEKKPELRFQTAQEVASLLEQWLAHLQQPATVTRPVMKLQRAETTPAASIPIENTSSVDESWLNILTNSILTLLFFVTVAISVSEIAGWISAEARSVAMTFVITAIVVLLLGNLIVQALMSLLWGNPSISSALESGTAAKSKRRRWMLALLTVLVAVIAWRFGATRTPLAKHDGSVTLPTNPKESGPISSPGDSNSTPSSAELGGTWDSERGDVIFAQGPTTPGGTAKVVGVVDQSTTRIEGTLNLKTRVFLGIFREPSGAAGPVRLTLDPDGKRIEGRYYYADVRLSTVAPDHSAAAWHMTRKTSNSSPAIAVAPFNATQAKVYQAAWAKHLGVEVEQSNTINMKLRLIPPGEYTQGTAAGAADQLTSNKDWYFTTWVNSRRQAEGPPRRVKISQPLYVGMHEVTVGQFAEFLKDSKHQTTAETEAAGGYHWSGEAWKRDDNARWHNPGFLQSHDHPVCNVSWSDAVAFCEWLSRKEQVEYRLLREAEWEYACRAGTTTLFSTGDDPASLEGFANIADATTLALHRSMTWSAPWNDGFAFTAPVGSFKPNNFGLFDMHGNTHEWCLDGYDDKAYAQSPAIDPVNPAENSRRVYRGGGWDNWIGFCRSADRYSSHSESLRTEWAGFRVVRTFGKPKAIQATEPDLPR